MAINNYLIVANGGGFAQAFLHTSVRFCVFDSPNDVVYAPYYNTYTYLHLAFSTNKGVSWSTTEYIDGYVCYKPSCYVHSDGTLHIVYYRAWDGWLRYRSRTLGGSWSSATNVYQPGTTSLTVHFPFVDSSGNIYAAILRSLAGFYRRIQICYFNGVSWSAPTSGRFNLPAGHHCYNFDVKNIGNILHTAYEDTGGGQDLVGYLTFSGGAWSSPVTVTSSADTKRCISIAVCNTTGHKYITWIQNSQVYGSIDTGSGWSSPAQITSESHQIVQAQIRSKGSGNFRLYFMGDSADPGNIGIQNIASMDYNGSWGSKLTLTTYSSDCDLVAPARVLNADYMVAFGAFPIDYRFLSGIVPVVAGRLINQFNWEDQHTFPRFF